MPTVKLHTDSSKADNNDHRLVVIGWKRPQNISAHEWEKVKPPQYSVSIPKLTVEVEPKCLQSALQSAFNGIVNDYIRGRVVDSDPAERNGLIIGASELTSQAISEWHRGSANGRLKGETIKAWFESELAAPLLEAFATKMQLQLDDPTAAEKLAKVVTNYGERLAKLASPATKYDPPIVHGLRTALALISGDSMADRLDRRLESFLMISKPKDDEFEAL